MTMDAYNRRSFSGSAPDATLSADIDDTTLTVTCDDLTGWPDGTGGPFEVTLGPDTSSEEKCWGSARSGNTITLLARGMEGSAVAHAATTTTVRHGFSALDADEANYAVSQTVGKVAAKGDIIVGSAANTFTKLGIGTTGQALVVASGTLAYGKPTLAESDITGLVDDLAGKLDTPATAIAKGSLLVGTGANVVDSLAVGAAGGILVAQSDGSLAYLDIGVDGTVLTVSGGDLVYGANPSGVLGSTAYSSSVSVPITKAALDATNLTITFTAPTSGKVLLRIATLAQINGFTSLGWYTHGTTTAVGTDQPFTPTSAQFNGRASGEQILTGLTAGQTYHLDLTGHASTNGGAISDTTLTVWAA